MVRGKNEVLTTIEACEYLRISRPTFLKLVYSNQIKARKIGKERRRNMMRNQLRGETENETSHFAHPNAYPFGNRVFRMWGPLC
jgi:excisionase family DNA binding protein